MVLRTLPAGRITPSKPNFWGGRGTPVEGSPFTYEQLQTMARERPSLTTFERFRHKIQPAHKSLMGPPPDPIFIVCPVICRSRDRTRVLVVTPSGYKEWVDDNG
jgi:hypothetical protein